MMNYDTDKWRKFQDEALKFLTFEPDANAIFVVKIINSFAPSITWCVTKSARREEKKTFFAEFRRWRSDIDQEKFRSPVELLKQLSSLKPTVENERFEIESKFIDDAMNCFYSISIPPIIGLQTFGLDGSTTEIEFGGSFLNSKFSWWNNPPKEWKELGNIVENILIHLNSNIRI